jgi:tetratricopeptide (TPR) repeat protein
VAAGGSITGTVLTGDIKIGPDLAAIEEAIRRAHEAIAADQHKSALETLQAYFGALHTYSHSFPYVALREEWRRMPIRRASVADGLPSSLHEVYIVPFARPVKTSPDRDASMPITGVFQQLNAGPGSRQLLLLGGPGAGKSALLRYLAAQLCAEFDTPEIIGVETRHVPMLVSLPALALAKDAEVPRRLRLAWPPDLALPGVPDGFFEEWPRLLSAHWLLLLDGLDEVPPGQQEILAQWLLGFLEIADLRGHQVVIASRPTSIAPMLQGRLTSYELEPFTPEQGAEFTRKWFGFKAGEFRQDLQRVSAAVITDTPLVLTIAAATYQEHGHLPEWRATLYEQFIDIWLTEAERRGVWDEWGNTTVRGALERIALQMTEHPEQRSAEMLGGVVENRLLEELDRGALQGLKGNVSDSSKRFLDQLARGSGVLFRQGGVYDWVHPTFREYLTASALAQQYGPDAREAMAIVNRWVAAYWREVVLFLLEVWSKDGKDISQVLKPILAVARDPQAKRGERAAAARALGQLGRVDEAAATLVALAQDSLVDGSTHDLAVKSLAQLGRAHELLVLAREHGWSSRHVRVARALGQLGHVDEAAATLVALARKMPGVGAVEALRHLGRVDEAAATLLALAQEPHVEDSERRNIAEALGQLGRADEAAAILLALAQEPQAQASKRIKAAEVLGRLGRVDEAAAILVAIAQDPQEDDNIRPAAAAALGQLGRVDEAVPILLTAACNREVDYWSRGCAVEALGQLGRVDELLRLLPASAQDPDKHFLSAWPKAAEALGRLGRVDEAAAILVAVARAPLQVSWHGVDGDVEREEAINALGRLGRAEELLLLARDPPKISYISGGAGIQNGTRIDIARALGRAGRADEAAAILLCLAQIREPYEDLTRANAVNALAGLGRADELLLLARDSALTRKTRQEAARNLELLGRASDAAPILVALAGDSDRIHTTTGRITRSIKRWLNLGRP